VLRTLTAGVAAHLLEPPVNVLRLALHPDGLAPRITNFAQWRAHLLGTAVDITVSELWIESFFPADAATAQLLRAAAAAAE